MKLNLLSEVTQQTDTLDTIMRIAIAPLKLNFASWLRTNAYKKGLSIVLS